MCFSPQRRAIFQHLNFKKWSETLSFLTFWLGHVLLATAACNFSTSELQKVFRDRQFFSILTSKCASRHSGVQFFHIWTAESGPDLTCFVHFQFKMRFSPQRRAIFWTSQLQKVLRACSVLYIFTWKCASRHSGVQFLISPLTTWLRTRRFSEPTFRLTGHTNHWKNTAFRDFSNIWRGWIFFLLPFALLTLLSADFTSSICFSSAFQLSILSEVYYLNFLRIVTKYFHTIGYDKFY